jgi:signal transduction histidine kinase
MLRPGRLLDVLLAAVLVVSAVLTVVPSPAPHPLVEVVAALWMCGIAFRSLALTATVLVMALGAVAYSAIPGAPVTPLWAFVSALLVSFSIGLQARGRRGLVLGGLLLACALVLSVTSAQGQGFSDTWVSPVVIVLAPLLAGRLLQHERRQSAALARLSEELVAERAATARAAATEERNRVAGDLHDVISRSVSTMVVQAGAAELMLEHGSSAREPLEVVRRTGRQALVELQQQLGALGVGGVRARSVPDLSDLGRLAEETGAQLVYDADSVGDVPPGGALTAYRVVQEALTNARKHAAGAPVLVRVVRAEGVSAELEVEVVNGPGRALADAPRGGHGLTGMSERVGLYAGRLETGTTRDGGWRVHVTLPLASSPLVEGAAS